MNNNNKTAAIVSYITWIGFFIAFCISDRSDRFTVQHLNQALILNIAGTVGSALSVIPLIGNLASSLVSLVVLVLWIMGIYRAIKGSDTPLPIIGELRLIK